MLGPEEIEKIKEQEAIRVQLYRELTPETHRGLWELLNSQFALWLLGSVLLSGITFYWNYRNDERVSQEKNLETEIVKQREDSQFLIQLLPSLTNADHNVQLRAIDVIKTRYPEDKIPHGIQRLMANIVVGANALSREQQSVQQADETKRLVGNVVRTLDKLSIQYKQQPDLTAVATIQQLPARVYLQIFDEKQREQAQALQLSLRQQGFLVPGIENVGEKAQAIKHTEIRFFDGSDKDTAKQVKDILNHSGFSTVEVRQPKIKANPRTLEVWLAKSD